MSPELIQVATASTRWQQPFDASLTDVFQVQAEVASRVAEALDVALGARAQQALGGTPTANLAAYDLYLQGNEAAGGIDQVAPPALRRAIGFYERAVELDSSSSRPGPSSPGPIPTSIISVPTAQGDSEARAAADRALSLAPGLAEAHLALGDYYHWVRRDGTAALAAYTRGSRLAPNNAELLKGLGLAERSRGNWELSQRVFTRAFALDPRSVSVARRLTYNLTRMHRSRRRSPRPTARWRSTRPQRTCGSPRRSCSWARASCPRRARCWRKACATRTRWRWWSTSRPTSTSTGR